MKIGGWAAAIGHWAVGIGIGGIGNRALSIVQWGLAMGESELSIGRV